MARLAAFCLLATGLAPAWATTVSYDLANVGGSTWAYSYTVSNDTLGVDIEEFTVFFDVNLYANLSLVASPAGWDPIVIQPDGAIPDDGFYDALALSGGIMPGNSLSGFSVQFDFLGTGTPGDQLFDSVDPLSFASLDSGFTQAAAVIPLPAALWLFMSGLAGFSALGKKSKCVKALPRA